MAVYVDEAMIPYRRMKMSHMIADTLDELFAMADRIGVPRKWLQDREGGGRPHFDVCKAKRELAIQAGAVPVSSRELIRIARRKRWRGNAYS